MDCIDAEAATDIVGVGVIPLTVVCGIVFTDSVVWDRVVVDSLLSCLFVVDTTVPVGVVRLVSVTGVGCVVLMVVSVEDAMKLVGSAEDDTVIGTANSVVVVYAVSIGGVVCVGVITDSLCVVVLTRAVDSAVCLAGVGVVRGANVC